MSNKVNNTSIETVLGPVGQDVEARLGKAFDPTHLKVIDESHKHIGHSGHRPEGETHFKVIIKSGYFDEYSRVSRHQEIYKVLADLMETRIHALSIDCS
jgi:BolA protein